MQFSEGSKNKGICVICGKEVPVRDIRANKYTYCGRKCAAMARYAGRYRGTNAGPADRPQNLLDKTKEL